jgi:hypothetical protein
MAVIKTSLLLIALIGTMAACGGPLPTGPIINQVGDGNVATVGGGDSNGPGTCSRPDGSNCAPQPAPIVPVVQVVPIAPPAAS